MEEKRKNLKREGAPMGKDHHKEKVRVFEVTDKKDASEIPSTSQSIPQPPLQQQVYSQIPMHTPQYGYPYNAENYVDPNQRNFNMMHAFNVYSGWAMNNSPNMAAASNVMPPPTSAGMEIAANPAMNMYPPSGYPYMQVHDPNMYIPMGPENSASANGIENGVPFLHIAKERITLNGMALNPPRPNDPKPSVNKKPQGCKTVYVGGLPDGITEEKINAIFSKYAEVERIRMSEKNFCHIRFADTMHTDIVLQLSGYRLQLDSNDPKDGSRIHVDYAFARNDQHEFNCLERARERERRHRVMAESADNVPPPVPHFSETEMNIVVENLKKEETFKSGVHSLATWLEKGECSKSTASSFFSMMQSSSTQVRKMHEEKNNLEHTIETMKDNLMEKTRKLALHFEDVSKVLDQCFQQRNWDQFSKAQRRQIENWRNDINSLKTATSDELVAKRNEEEMELEETEDTSSPIEVKTDEIMEKLRATDLLIQDLSGKLKNLQLLHNAKLQELEDLKEAYVQLDMKYKTSESIRNTIDQQLENPQPSSSNVAPGMLSLSEQEVLLISLVSTFLNVHPFGASIDYICSYLIKMIPNVSARDVETLLRRFPSVFKEISSGIGACLEKKWLFLGLQM